jgi:hypothetical protein
MPMTVAYSPLQFDHPPAFRKPNYMISLLSQESPDTQLLKPGSIFPVKPAIPPLFKRIFGRRNGGLHDGK